MNSVEQIRIELGAAWVDEYCGELARSVSSLEKRLAALDAISTFIATAASPAEQVKPSYTRIRTTLSHHFELALQALMQERGERIVRALGTQDISQLSTIFHGLSRESFWQLLEQAEAVMEEREWQKVVSWSQQWMQQAKQRAEDASPYPDAIDFKAAGIAVTEYATMSDLSKFCGNRN